MRIPASIRIAGIYILVAAAWILGSDRSALALFGDATQLTSVQTAKGIGFVLASGLLIGLLVQRERSRWLTSERAAVRHATRFEALFRSSPAGILLVDLDAGRYIDANTRLLELFGYRRDELIGRRLDEVDLWADPDDRTLSRALSKTAQLLDRTDLFRRSDGSIATMIWSAERVRSADSSWLTISIVDVSKASQAYDETIEGWARALDQRDNDTAHHSLRVTWAAEELARRMDVEPADLVHIRRGALLHDIGKIAVPDAILHKPGPLTDDEWIVMRKHPETARELLEPISYLHDAMAIPVYHHEHWDGSGYPYGLAGEAIPFAARLFAVVDVWDALTSDRPYRDAWSDEDAFAHMREQAGKQFDPACFEAFEQMREEGVRLTPPPDADAPAQLRR